MAIPSRTGGCQVRVSSPFGPSTLMTSAPRSASSMVAYGPARMRERSATRIPASGPRGLDSATPSPHLVRSPDKRPGYVEVLIADIAGVKTSIDSRRAAGPECRAQGIEPLCGRTSASSRGGDMAENAGPAIVLRGGTVLTMDADHRV